MSLMAKLPVGFFPRIWYILQHYWQSFLIGAGKTFVIAVVSTAIGCIIGFIVGIIQSIPINDNDPKIKKVFLKIVRFIMSAYVEVFRGTPMMVQSMVIYYGLTAAIGHRINTWVAAIFIVSINTGAYMAETVRGGILAVDIGQTEGAMAIGMTHTQTMINVILPQALRSLIPQIGNNLIINIKDTCVLSCISVVELFYTTKGVAGAYYTYFEAFAITMVIYFVMTFFCSRLLRLWEKKIAGPKNFDLATTDTLAQTSGMNNSPLKPDGRMDSWNRNKSSRGEF